jgi:hypothetical protein
MYDILMCFGLVSWNVICSFPFLSYKQMAPYCCVTRKRAHIYVFRKHITGIQTENNISLRKVLVAFFSGWSKTTALSFTGYKNHPVITIDLNGFIMRHVLTIQ